MEEIILTSPCDLYGRKATSLYHFMQSLNTNVWIEKIELERRVDCSSLIGILSLGIVKGDKINISAYEKKYLDDILKYLNDLIV